MPKWVAFPVIVILVLLSGLFSGLTLGLMGLDLNGLQIVESGGTDEQAQYAARIIPLRKNGNLLLCTLLLGNVAVNSALSILLGDIANGLVGFLISTPMIVIFGEIIPQAVCSRYALQIGAKTVPVVKVMIVLFYIFTKPLSMILDCVLGHEIGTVMTGAEVMEMLKLQVSLGAVNPQFGEMAKQVAEGAFSFRDKQAKEVMTPLEDVYMLSAETRLGYITIREIFETGFSRIPVFGKDRNDIVGLLYTKDLMLADPEDDTRLGDWIAIFNRKVETFSSNTNLVDVLNRFKKGGTHMGLIRNLESDAREILGLCTLEDIVEEIIQAEIVDETDVYIDVDNQLKVGDGRENVKLDLGIFDPVWKLTRQERLSREELRAIAAHLHRSLFAQHLSIQAVEFLVATSEVRTQKRVTALGVEMPSEEDCLYHCGSPSDVCTVILQGRVGVTVGRDQFRSEAGAFSVLAKEALFAEEKYTSDFHARLSTAEVRILLISKARFEMAKALDGDKEGLQKEWHATAGVTFTRGMTAGAALRSYTRDRSLSMSMFFENPKEVQDDEFESEASHRMEEAIVCAPTLLANLSPSNACLRKLAKTQSVSL